MNEYSALRMEQAGEEGGGGPTIWDFYVNMDNVFLQSEIKSSQQDADVLRTKFKFGMALLGLGFLQDRLRSGNADPSSAADNSAEAVDLEDVVATASDAIAPMLLPMLAALGDLEASDIDSDIDPVDSGGDEG